MSIHWQPLLSELALWRREGLDLPIWWRDDDAVADTPALQRLLDLRASVDCPLHLAVIPQPAQPSLAAALSGQSDVIVLVHGWQHLNHAPATAKKAEFGQPRAQASAETQAGLDRLQTMFPDQVLCMFVPPWNRIHDSVTGVLAAQGYELLSTFTPRAQRQGSGVVHINTHIDPIHWRGGGGLIAPDQIIAQIVELLQDRRAGKTDATEPLGFLTHHLVHDPAIWDFTKDCLSLLLDGGARPCHLLHQKGTL